MGKSAVLWFAPVWACFEGFTVGINSGHWSLEAVQFAKVVFSNTCFVIKELYCIREVITAFNLPWSVFK